VLLPALLEVPKRSGLAELLDDPEMPVPVELLPLLEPVPVLLPAAPVAPVALDSRISDTLTSGAPWLAGKVTIASPYPFSTLLEPAVPCAAEEEEDPLNPELLEELLERSAEVEEEPIPPLEELDIPLVPELVSVLRLLLPVPPLVLLDFPVASTGQLLRSAGLETSPWTMVRSLN